MTSPGLNTHCDVKQCMNVIEGKLHLPGAIHNNDPYLAMQQDAF